MKLTVAWNVWDNYLDVALGSEILRRENEQTKHFQELHLISQGGYPEPPSREYAQYLDGHFFVAYPDVPLIAFHVKYKGVLRVLEGIQRAFRYAEVRGHDFVLVTNGDAWPLSIEKLFRILSDPAVTEAAVSMRVGSLTGLELNFGSRVPLFDDHFIILNVRECTTSGVFDYDHSARFFRPHHPSALHYLLCLFVDQRVPAGKFHIYSDISDTMNHYGDWMGWNLLPWQYQLSTGFLHANCAQVFSLNALRAAFLNDLGFTRYPLVARYYRDVVPDPLLFTRRNGMLVYKKPLSRRVRESFFWWAYRAYCATVHEYYERRYARFPSSDVRKKTLEYFDAFHHIKPAILTQ